MSEFEVKVVKIDDVIDHPNADRLSIVKIAGYDCISAKLEDGSHRYKPGNLVVYIPEQSILPDSMLKKMGFWDQGRGTLSGSSGNRVKAIKLRQVVSQGILYPVHSYHKPTGEFVVYDPDYGQYDDNHKFEFVSEGTNVAEFLGITKYEPTIPVSMRGKVGNLFGYTKSYDIENLQKYNNVFQEGEPVVMTEKLHGTLCQIGFLTNLPEDKRDDVLEIAPGIWVYATSKGLAKSGLIQKATDDNLENIYVKAMQDFLSNGVAVSEVKNLLNGDTHNVYIFGEIYGKGVQDLDYGTDAPQFKVFDIYISNNYPNSDNYIAGKYMESLELTNFCIRANINRVPLIYTGPFSMQEAIAARDGKTVAGNQKHIREGVVIRPFIEREQRGLPDNRAQLKFVSPDYLLRKDGTEFQ